MLETSPPAPTERVPAQPDSPYSHNLIKILTGPLAMKIPNEGKSVSPRLFNLQEYHDSTVLADEKDPQSPERQYPLTDLIKNNSTRLIESILKAEINPSTSLEEQLKRLEYHRPELDELGITATVNKKGKLVVTEKKVERGSPKQEVVYQEMILKRLSLTLATLSSDLEAIGSLVGKQDRDGLSAAVINKLLSPDSGTKKNPFANRNLLVNISGKKENLKGKEFFQALRQACAETHDQWLQAKTTAHNTELTSMLKQSEVMSNLAKQMVPDSAKKIAGETLTLRDDSPMTNTRREQLGGERNIMQEKVEPVVLLDWAMARYSDIKLPPAFLVEEQKIILERESARKSGNVNRTFELTDKLNQRRQVMRLAMLEQRNFNLETDPMFASNPELVTYISQLKQSPDFTDCMKQLAKREKQLKSKELPLAQIRPEMLKDFIGTLVGTPNEAQKKIISNITLLINVPGGQSLDELNKSTVLSLEQKKQIAEQFAIIKKGNKNLKTSDGLTSFLQKLNLSDQDQQLAQMFFKVTQAAVVRDELSAEQKFALGFSEKFDSSKTPSLLERANPDYNRQSINTTHINEEAATKGLAYLLKSNARLERAVTNTGGWIIRVANEVPKGQLYKNNKGADVVAQTDTKTVSENGVGTTLILVEVGKGENRLQPKINVIHTKDGVRYVTEGIDVESGMNAAAYAKIAERASVDYVQDVGSLREVVQTSPPESPTPADIAIDYPVAGQGALVDTLRQQASVVTQPPAEGKTAPKTLTADEASELLKKDSEAALSMLENIKNNYEVSLQDAQTTGDIFIVRDVVNGLRLRQEAKQPITKEELVVANALLTNPNLGKTMQVALELANINLAQIERGMAPLEETPTTEEVTDKNPKELKQLTPIEISRATKTLNLIETRTNDILTYAKRNVLDQTFINDVVNGLRLRLQRGEQITPHELNIQTALLENPASGEAMRTALDQVISSQRRVTAPEAGAAEPVITPPIHPPTGGDQPIIAHEPEKAGQNLEPILQAEATLTPPPSPEAGAPTVDRTAYNSVIKALKDDASLPNSPIWAVLESAQARLENGQVHYKIPALTLSADGAHDHDFLYLTRLNEKAREKNLTIIIDNLIVSRTQDETKSIYPGSLQVNKMEIIGQTGKKLQSFFLRGADVGELIVTDDSLIIEKDGENSITIDSIRFLGDARLALKADAADDLITNRCTIILPSGDQGTISVDRKPVTIEKPSLSNQYRLQLVDQQVEDLDIPVFLRNRAAAPSGEKIYKLVPIEEVQGSAEARFQPPPPPPLSATPPFVEPKEDPLNRFHRLTQSQPAAPPPPFAPPKETTFEATVSSPVRIELTNLINRLFLDKDSPEVKAIEKARVIGFGTDGKTTRFKVDDTINLEGLPALAIVNNLASRGENEAALELHDLYLSLRRPINLDEVNTVSLGQIPTEQLVITSIGQPLDVSLNNFRDLTFVNDSLNKRGNVDLHCSENVGWTGDWSDRPRTISLSANTDLNIDQMSTIRLSGSRTVFRINDIDGENHANISINGQPLRIPEGSTANEFVLKITNLSAKSENYKFILVPAKTSSPPPPPTPQPPPHQPEAEQAAASRVSAPEPSEPPGKVSWRERLKETKASRWLTERLKKKPTVPAEKHIDEHAPEITGAAPETPDWLITPALKDDL